MFRNYFITAVRSLWRSKTSTFINIAGLTLGVATSLILFLLVRNQTSFDRYHAKADRIYRVVRESNGNEGRNYGAGVPPVFWEAFKNDFAEAEEVVFTSFRAGDMISVPQSQGEPKKFGDDNGIVFTQPSFFKLFDRKILSGDTEKGLDEPNEAVVSKKAALKFFGKEDVLGEVISHDGKDYKVTAIMEDYPTNTDFPFNVMLSYITIKKEKDENGWNSIWSDEQCYFLLKRGSSIEEIERRFPEFRKKHRGEKNTDKEEYHAQALASIHHDDRFGNYNYNTSSYEKITAMSVIGIFLILTACINFINLVTAEAIKRSKEVGIRKTLGSSRGQLVMQFLGESTLVTLFAVVLSVCFAQLVLPVINSFLKISLSLNFFSDASLWIFIIAVAVIVSFLSGLYPSFVVSGFRPVFAIKNQTGNRNSSGYHLRKGLVVAQFVISQFLIISTIVMIMQMDYFSKKDLGFKKDAIVNIPIPERETPAFETKDGVSKMRTLREELVKMPGIESASLCNNPPSSGSVSGTDFQMEGKEDRFNTQVKMIDNYYLDLYGLKLLAGQNVSDADTAQGFIVNEKLAAMVGYKNPQDIIGQRIKMWGKTLPIVGVVNNFHTMSLHEPIEATIMLNRIRSYYTLSLKVNLKDFKENVKQIQSKWEAAYSSHIFSYKFLDDELKEFYEGEQKMSSMITVFTSIAIFIGCLGLFGLATFMANQKTKEIGVRKVLGASVEGIVFMFSKEYVRLIALGFVFAAPAAWYVMNQWLNKFAYKIEIGPSIFAAGIALTALIAVITVGYKSFAAATTNPVNSLRSE